MQSDIIQLYSQKIEEFPFYQIMDKISALEFFLTRSEADAARLVSLNRFNIYRKSNKSIDNAMQEFMEGVRRRYLKLMTEDIKKKTC